MGLHDWLDRTLALHSLAKENTLVDESLADYQRSLEEIATMVLAAQRLTLKRGETARRTVRVPLVLDVSLRISGGFLLRAQTVDISVGGCAVQLGYAPGAGEQIAATLQLPDGALQLKGSVGNVKKAWPGFRVSIVFAMLPQAANDRLQFLVFDAVLAELRF